MDFARVLKTGAAAGAIYGVLQGIVAVLSFVFYREQIIEVMRAAIPSGVNIGMTMDQLANISMMTAIPGSVIGGIISGIIVSFIFSLMYGELMGKDSRRKGIFLCILLTIGVVLGELAYPGGFVGSILLIQTGYLMLAPLSIAFFLCLGYLTGIFYDRFEDSKHRKKAAECKPDEEKEKSHKKK
jgi:hypothetical protein